VPPATAGDRYPITLDEDNPDRLFTRGVQGGDIKKLIHGIQLIVVEVMH
jgi:hypothetical protein